MNLQGKFETFYKFRPREKSFPPKRKSQKHIQHKSCPWCGVIKFDKLITFFILFKISVVLKMAAVFLSCSWLYFGLQRLLAVCQIWVFMDNCVGSKMLRHSSYKFLLNLWPSFLAIQVQEHTFSVVLLMLFSILLKRLNELDQFEIWW